MGDKKKAVAAKVMFYDKAGKQFFGAEFYDRVPDPKWIGRKMNKALNASVLAVIQPMPVKGNKKIIVKDQVKKLRSLTDTQKDKFKKLGADV